MQTLAEEAPSLEVYSIDEAFMDMSGIIDLESLGRHLRQRIFREQRIPMGVGIGPTKGLAKLANKAAKAWQDKLGGVCVLDTPKKWRWLQQRWPVTEVWGISAGLEKRLAKLNVTTIEQLANLPLSTARDVGGVVLSRIVQELNGIPCLSLETEVPDRQQIICSRSFGQKTDDINVLKSALASFATRAHNKLQKQDSVTGELSIWIKTSRHTGEYYFNSAVVPFDPPTNSLCLLRDSAVKAVEHLFKPDIRYAKAGVSLSKIRSKSMMQTNLFVGDNTEVSDYNGLFKTINQRFGKSTLVMARQLNNDWKMNQQFLSPSYLTKWSDIPHSKIE